LSPAGVFVFLPSFFSAHPGHKMQRLVCSDFPFSELKTFAPVVRLLSHRFIRGVRLRVVFFPFFLVLYQMAFVFFFVFSLMNGLMPQPPPLFCPILPFHPACLFVTHLGREGRASIPFFSYVDFSSFGFQLFSGFFCFAGGAFSLVSKFFFARAPRSLSLSASRSSYFHRKHPVFFFPLIPRKRRTRWFSDFLFFLSERFFCFLFYQLQAFACGNLVFPQVFIHLACQRFFVLNPPHPEERMPILWFFFQ